MLFGTYEDDPIVFDRWQIEDMHDYSRIRVREKAPQIGASWIRAAEALWEAIMFEDATTAFVSMDQREASEKVLYARKLYDGLPELFRRWVPLVKDSVEEIGFGQAARPSRIISLPNTSALRGRKMSVVLDEADFYKDGGMSSYRAGIGRIARGGRLTANSTCWGIGTLIDNLMQGIDETGLASAQTGSVSKARYPHTVIEQPDLMEGVELARETLDDGDFAEEYECVRGLTGSSPFTPDLLRSRLHEEEQFIINDRRVYPFEDGDQAPLVAGYDVGKGSGRHPSILSLYRRFPDGVWRQVAIHQPMSARDKAMTLPEQHDWLIEMMTRLPQMKLIPDGQGIGAHIAQDLEKRFGHRRVIIMIPGSRPQHRASQDKDLMVTETKRQLEAAEMELMPDVEQMKQFTRTKKDEQGRFVQRGGNKRDHYDRFWASVYAAYGIGESRKGISPYSRHGLVVIGGERGVA